MATKRNETMLITGQNGHAYDLDRIAVDELQKAGNAADADAIFERFAADVPASDRLQIWLAVENYTL